MILTQRLFPVDGIALPAFGPSGMENWGLVKYRETNLLLKEGETSSSSREGIAKLVAHEIGHQVRLVLQYLSSCSASCTFSCARKTQQSENIRRAILHHLKSCSVLVQRHATTAREADNPTTQSL